jgi:uncharacterized protein with FMN-binding domain
MKKYFLSFLLIIAFVFYVILENRSSISVVSNSSAGSNGMQSGNNTTSAPQSMPLAASASLVPASAGIYRDGSYDGDSVNAYFGNVQVEAVISGGKLTDVKILDYPQDRTTSARINNGALPKLVQEAIVSQSAQVDIVSGATQTSQGFQQSLASALAKAKN